jgi:hypothetical protein
MENFKRAEEFYLRGFRSEYIKRRTGVSTQRLLKYLLKNGVKYTKDDIVSYQINYIRCHFTTDEIKDAYRRMSEKFDNLDKAAHSKKIECLGCGFGQHARVFSELLGKNSYKILRNECWQTKQKKRMKDLYGVENAFEKGSGLLKVNPMHSDECREKRKQTMLSRYGCEHPNQNAVIKSKMLTTFKDTMIDRYGVENPMQNKDMALKASVHRQETMLVRYGAANSVQVDEIRNKIFETRRKNGTLNSSKAEDVLYEMLLEHFGNDDVFRNICVDDRYPFHVDFYIKSRDLFIELNGDKCHNTHWFDENNERDIQVLNSWKMNMLRVESETGRPSRYRKYIETWTVRDVQKRQIAKHNGLNYLVFWDGSRKIRRNNSEFPRLRDVNEWFNAGCPDSKDWKSENTY